MSEYQKTYDEKMSIQENLIKREENNKSHDSKENPPIIEKEYISDCGECGQFLGMNASPITYEEREKYGYGYIAIKYKGKILCPYCLIKLLWQDGIREIEEDKMDKELAVKENENLLTKIQSEKTELSTQNIITQMIPTSGTLKITDEQKNILYAKVKDEDVEIRPDGLIYLPWMGYVSRLTEAFNCEWAIIPQGEPKIKENYVYIGCYLVIQGKLMGFAIGEQQYFPDSPTMTYGDAIEGATSNALMRLCKRIGIGLELWKPSFVRAWIEKYAEKYWDTKKNKYLWKRKSGHKIEETIEQEIETPPESKTCLTIPQAIEKKKGDTFNLIGIVTNAEEYQNKNKVWVAKYYVTDNEDNKIIISNYGHVINDLKENDTVIFSNVIVYEFKGENSYLAKTIEKIK